MRGFSHLFGLFCHDTKLTSVTTGCSVRVWRDRSCTPACTSTARTARRTLHHDVLRSSSQGLPQGLESVLALMSPSDSSQISRSAWLEASSSSSSSGSFSQIGVAALPPLGTGLFFLMDLAYDDGTCTCSHQSSSCGGPVGECPREWSGRQITANVVVRYTALYFDYTHADRVTSSCFARSFARKFLVKKKGRRLFVTTYNLGLLFCERLLGRQTSSAALDRRQFVKFDHRPRRYAARAAAAGRQSLCVEWRWAPKAW